MREHKFGKSSVVCQLLFVWEYPRRSRMAVLIEVWDSDVKQIGSRLVFKNKEISPQFSYMSKETNDPIHSGMRHILTTS